MKCRFCRGKGKFYDRDVGTYKCEDCCGTGHAPEPVGVYCPSCEHFGLEFREYRSLITCEACGWSLTYRGCTPEAAVEEARGSAEDRV